MTTPEDERGGEPPEDRPEDRPEPPTWEHDPAVPPEPIDASEDTDEFEAALERQAAEAAAAALPPKRSAEAEEAEEAAETSEPTEAGEPEGDPEVPGGQETVEHDALAEEKEEPEEDADPSERRTIVIRPGTAAGRAMAEATGAAAGPEAEMPPQTPEPSVEDAKQLSAPEQAATAQPPAPSASPVPPPAHRDAAPLEGEREIGQLTPAEGGIPKGMVVPPNYDRTQVSEEDIHRPRLWIRFLIASIVIFISFAAATSTTVLLYFQNIARKLGSDPALAGAVDILNSVNADEPQTILLVGSDRRFGDKSKGIPSRSDTVILMRLDPDRGAIALLRLPRDLKVRIPGLGTDKLNAAYAFGGPKKTLQTVKDYLGVEVHHIVNVSFRGFKEAVDAIDCVYVDVDRRYFHSNQGLAASQQYAEIDLKPGYQKLCGTKALDYVRYRHEDNDIVRGARQQEFLRQARQKIGPGRLLRDRRELLDIFTSNTSSDIHSGITMLEILKLFVAARRSPIKEVNLRVKFGDVYVTASEPAIEKAKRQFLGLRATPGPRGDTAEPEGTRIDTGRGKKKRKPKDPTTGAAIYDASVAAADQRTEAQSKLAFPVYVPTRLERGSQFVDRPRTYDLFSPDHRRHRAYKMVIRTSQREYYGVMGTDWKKPPILNSPDRTIRLNGRSFLIYSGTENRPRMVAWKTPTAVYWISNTLRGALTRREMLAIARSTRRAQG